MSGKTWRKLSEVKLPVYMQNMARDERGYPIPASNRRKPKPDFRVLEGSVAQRLAHEKRCAICGRRVLGLFAFVGGPSSISHRLFADGPMHPECAEYAMQVCPFLAAPSFAYNKAELPDTITLEVSTERPERFGLGVCESYAARVHQQAVYYEATPFSTLVWFKGGQLTLAPEGFEP